MSSATGHPYFDDVCTGTVIPPYSVELTLQRLVMEAGANRDFAPSHFDRDLARAEGLPDVFANTMLLQTLFEVMLRQWMGPAGRIRKLGLRMKAMNFVDQTLSAHGTVSAIQDRSCGLIELDIWQETPRQGRTVTGAAVVQLPLRSHR